MTPTWTLLLVPTHGAPIPLPGYLSADDADTAGELAISDPGPRTFTSFQVIPGPPLVDPLIITSIDTALPLDVGRLLDRLCP